MIKKNKQLLFWVVCLIMILSSLPSSLVAFAEKNEVLNQQLMTTNLEEDIKKEDKDPSSRAVSVVLLDDDIVNVGYEGRIICSAGNGTMLNIYLENHDATRNITIKIEKGGKEIINTPVLAGKNYTYTRSLDVYGNYRVVVGNTSGFKMSGYVRARQYEK